MMLSCAIDTKEKRYVVVSNAPGNFLHSNMKGNIHILLEGTVAEIIHEIISYNIKKTNLV